ncbi:MAG: tetratricopeptide repeat protein [Bryobacteraceae bacterium]
MPIAPTFRKAYRATVALRLGAKERLPGIPEPVWFRPLRVRVTVFRPVLLVLLVSLGAATGQTPEQQLEQYFRSGQQALQQREFARAAEDFKKVLALDPTLVEAEVNLGLAYQGLLQYELAVRYLAKALKERPSLPGPTLIVGLDYLKLGTPEKAIPFLAQAVKLDPSNAYAREALASCYLSQENFRRAADQFREISLLNPDKAEAWFKLGHQYLDLAARLAYQGARVYRDSAWGRRFIGDLLFQRNRWADAVKEYQKALNIEPKQAGLHTLLGQSYLHAQKLEQAETEFRLELERDRRYELAWIGLANLRLAQNQPKGALESLDKVWQISPEFLAVQREFPSVEVAREVVKTQISAVEDAPDGPVKHYLLAALYSAANDTGSGEREWKAFQNDFSAWQKNADRAAVPAKEDPCQTHRYSRCIDSLQGRNNLTGAERLALGKAYFALQQYEPAATTLGQVQEGSSKDAEASYWLERSYQALGSETYARLEESYPASWRTRQLRAEGYALRGNMDNAVKEFQEALELRPNEPELHDALGEVYLDQHNYDAAQSELEKALALDDSRAHTLYLLGRVYVEQKYNEKAVPILERALRLQPDLPETNSLLGTAYLRLGQTANAVPRLEKAASTDHYGNVHYQLYQAYRKLGQPDRAQKELERSKDLRRNALEQDQAVVLGSPQPEAEQQ